MVKEKETLEFALGHEQAKPFAGRLQGFHCGSEERGGSVPQQRDAAGQRDGHQPSVHQAKSGCLPNSSFPSSRFLFSPEGTSPSASVSPRKASSRLEALPVSKG